jgi:hypothetical protein
VPPPLATRREALLQSFTKTARLLIVESFILRKLVFVFLLPPMPAQKLAPIKRFHHIQAPFDHAHESGAHTPAITLIDITRFMKLYAPFLQDFAQ